MSYILYGGELSYYTGKARAYLRFKQLEFEERTATRQVYREVIVPGVGAPIIPVLACPDGELVQDTTEIIDFLERRHPEPAVYPSGACQRLAALLMEHYADEWLVIPAMHYRWSYLDQQYEFIMGEFGALSAPDASRDEQIAIGEKISAPFRGSIVGLGVNDATAGAIEQVYLETLSQLQTHFSRYPYLFGSRPSIGDFGLMGPLYAHLGRDPVPRAIMEREAPAVADWVKRMNAPTGEAGEFLPDDEVPRSLLPVLRTACEDFLPDVIDVVRHNSAFLEANPGAPLPRYLGMHRFSTGGVEGERVIHSYSQWMFQRALDHFQGLEGVQRDAASALLRGIGGLDAFMETIPRRVRREPGQLELTEETA